jgi:hypothetical protein
MTSFGKFAARMTYPAKTKLRIEKARQTKQEKKKDDDALLFRLWSEWHAERRKALLSGEHGSRLVVFVEWLERMTIEDGDELIERYRGLGKLDLDTKHELLSLVDRRCILIRERAKLVPFDDDLNEPSGTIFLQIRDGI